MIDVTIEKVDLFDNDEFHIQFTTRCDKCNVEAGQKIEGAKMTRVIVTCSACKESRRVNIVGCIEDTITNKWGYSTDDVEAVMEKLRKFDKGK